VPQPMLLVKTRVDAGMFMSQVTSRGVSDLNRGKGRVRSWTFGGMRKNGTSLWIGSAGLCPARFSLSHPVNWLSMRSNWLTVKSESTTYEQDNMLSI